MLKSCGKNKQKKKEAQASLDEERAALEARQKEEVDAFVGEEGEAGDEEEDEAKRQEEEEEERKREEEEAIARKRAKKLKKQQKRLQQKVEEEKRREEERIEGLSKSERVHEIEAIQGICLNPIE